MSKEQKAFLHNFKDLLGLYDEYYFTQGNSKRDYKYITDVIKLQGFWSGEAYRFYYDKDLNYLCARSRF